MTPAREAIALPLLFLTVLLLGSLRVAGGVELVAPTPYLLVLGVLLVRVVVQSGTLAPEQLMSSSRSALANVNGGMVLATLWLAGSQVLAVLSPESGVPRLAFSVFFLILLVNTGAAAPDRTRLLRSLAVTFGATFILKFVVLHGLSAPSDGPVKRALQALLDGVTVGVLMQDVPDPITPYIALLVVGLFLVGLVLLPHRGQSVRRTLVPTVEPAHPSVRTSDVRRPEL
jgi:hypothetical protein